MTASSPGGSAGGGSWASRFAVSPRAAVLLAAVVVGLALVVVAIGTLGTHSTAGVTVTSGPSVADGPGSVPGASVRPTAGADSDTGAGSPSATARAAVVSVYVLGAVVRAGVVEVPAGTRVDVVLQRAGGATADADLARLNLARPVVDGERLYVPRVGETEVPEALPPDAPGAGGSGAGGAGGAAAGGGTGGATGSGGDAGGAVVDLNTADQATLETLPGIGPALAARILAWREEHGGFATVDDLLEVSGIGDTRLAELRDRVRV